MLSSFFANVAPQALTPLMPTAPRSPTHPMQPMQSTQSMHATHATQRRQRTHATVATQARSATPNSVRTLPAMAALPEVATLPATATLPAVATLPATPALPAVATLPATPALPAVATLPATPALPADAVLATTPTFGAASKCPGVRVDPTVMSATYAAHMTSDQPARVRWLGHASVMIELAGTRVLTDPALTPRLAHLRRHHLVDVATLERPDLVLISHVHLDHLHIPSLRLFDADVAMIVPAGAAAFLRRKGFSHVSETRAGDTTTFGPLTIETVPAVHPSGRGPHSRVTADAVGYVVRAGDTGVYFAGDTDLFEAMGTFGPVDVALVPIWGWGRTIGEGHLDPE